MNTATRAEVRSSHLRAFDLGGDRVALVPEQAVLLGGDHVTVSVRLGAGQRLEIVEPGGTVAYAMRGGQARWDVLVEVDEGGVLVWHGEPFVVAEGGDVVRTTSIDLRSGARVALRETLVLGRSGESPGRLKSRTHVQRDGVPVLVEELDAALGLGPHRVVDQVLELGGPEGLDGLDRRVEATCLQLESGDRVHRWLGAETHRSPIDLSQSSPSEE
jgi:urease accessory protein